MFSTLRCTVHLYRSLFVRLMSVIDLTASFCCPRGQASSKWPISCFVQLDHAVNVNAHHGGGAALVLVSCAYGGDTSNTTAQVILMRYSCSVAHDTLRTRISCSLWFVAYSCTRVVRLMAYSYRAAHDPATYMYTYTQISLSTCT